ncbi:restriction endonuclease subunit R [Floridanema evergladense]|uniref:Restriction endonuclease subunit R n=1 Tax=Floridaenema evergladense BLCC-F167 TaxID=3153639 RepID=A0ABV4WPS2_9CYAN
MQSLSVKDITLYDLRIKFGLHLIEDEDFFPEWRDNLPKLSDLERQRLDRVKAAYNNLLEYPPMLENTVKMVVLSPLLDMADFYLPPFRIKSEDSIELSAEDEGVIYRGKIDVLVFKEKLWLMAIESKQATFSLETSEAQILAYMLATPHPEQSTFGMISDGSSFRFFKLVKSQANQYALSRLFNIRNPGNELYNVLRILKNLGQILK